MVWRPPCANGYMSSNQSTQIPLPHRPSCIPCRVLTQPQPRTSIKPTLIPSTQKLTTVNDHRVSGIGNGGSTAKEFIFDPEITGCIHAMWQDPPIPQMLDHSLVIVPDWWEYIYINS